MDTANETGRRKARWRFPGGRPFEDSPEDRQVFRGRDSEANRLFELAISARLLVLFGKSGLGKTSLLNAGLFPRLRGKSYLPVPIRVTGTASPSDTVIAAFVKACEQPGVRLSDGDRSGLWEFLSTALVWRGNLLLTPVLVFDQFEEVFTLRDAAFRAGLASELGALASGVAPRIGASAAAESEAVPEVKLLFSLREEYLGTLQELSVAIPGLFQERFRLTPLGKEAARKAIVEPGVRKAQPGERPFESPPFAFDAPAVDAMLAFLQGKSQVIEPFHLQLLCRHAEEDIVTPRRRSPALGILPAEASPGGETQADPVEAAQDTVTFSDLGGLAGMEKVLRLFYDGAIAQLPRTSRGAARRLCEEGLISPEGRRRPLDSAQIASDFHLAEAQLDALVDSRLLRREPQFESLFYEISHDRLAESIYLGRKWRIPRRLRVPLLVAGLGLAGVIAVLGVSVHRIGNERDAANEAKQVAEQKRDEARKQEFLAEVAKTKAADAALRAEEESDNAKEARRQADAKSALAADERDKATLAGRLAAKARIDAEKLVAFLIGEGFMEQLRPVGRSEILAEVQRQVDAYLRRNVSSPSPSTLLALGLAARNDGDLLQSGGKLSNAIGRFRESADLFSRLALVSPSDESVRAEQARSLERLGDALIDQGKITSALETHLEALRVRKQLAAAKPELPEAQIDLSLSHSAVARLLIMRGRPREALEQHLDPARALLASWAEDPPIVRWYKAQHDALNYRGEAFMQLGDDTAAAKVYGEALKITREWVKRHPLAADARMASATAFAYSVNLVHSQLNPIVERSRDKALMEQYDKLLLGFYDALEKQVDELVRWDPQNRSWRRDLEATHLLQADMLVVAGNHDKAAKIYAMASKQLEDLAAIDASDVSRQQDLAWAHQSRGELAAKTKDLAPSIAEYRESVRHHAIAARVDRTNVNAQRRELVSAFMLAWRLRDVGQLDEALQTVRAARLRMADLVMMAPDWKGLAAELDGFRSLEVSVLEGLGDKAGAEALRSQQR